jgi:REP element-mobilizing transposase RayT
MALPWVRLSSLTWHRKVRQERLTYFGGIPMYRYSRRHLPHEIPDDVPIFVTWNLKGAMPLEAIQRLEGQRKRLERQPAPAGESARDRRVREGKILFGIADKVLDTARSGPMHLQEPCAAKIVEDAILFGTPERYELYAWCVMANHVHVLLKPIWKFEKVMQAIKGFTAHEINGLDHARGRVFWQDESYDHWIRDEEEMARIIVYIENNPIAAGLCARPEDWLWSSARFRTHWPVGQPFQADFALPPQVEKLP